MTVVFCIDDNPQYLVMMQVAVRSLRALHPGARVVCVYAGDNAALMNAVQAEGVELARYTPTLRPEIIPQDFHRCIGAFLKLELALVAELANEPKVIYCDSDVMFTRPLDGLWGRETVYMSMAREATAPFFHDCERMEYSWRGNDYVVPMPFPIWTFSSGVVLFNLAKLRRHDHIHNFLAYCAQNVHRIGNLDQSLLNYFFGKRITRLEPCWNRPPYHADALATGHVIHFHGPKPWNVRMPLWEELRINDFGAARDMWRHWLNPAECARVDAWEEAD